ncbi:alpha/beta fold hydrolase [Nocardia concava]|uniref:alpha/beta fold hydrolase n=1 Tax=Nocardia concava TaxID=257281 RepID=UPI0005947236|nr:alpha/beta hydrolase [Nocardia concava]
MTEFLDLDGGRLAYDVEGVGPLLVLSHGIGDHRQVFRFLAPRLIEAGYRVATVDVRGHGESSLNWTSHDGGDAITRTDVAGDLLALIRQLGGPAVIIGHSISGGAATIAAASEPGLVRGIIEINPFTRVQPLLSLGALVTVPRYRRGQPRLLAAVIFRSLRLWLSYLDVAYPTRPADYDDYMRDLAAKLSEPGRFAEFLKTGKSTPADAQAQLPHIACPALVIMGDQDPDFPDPRGEADAIVAAMPPGLGSVAMIAGHGHYPHAAAADQVAELALKFLAGLEEKP